MADNRQYTALEWVVKEIKDTLLEAQRVLESYSLDSQDVTQLRFCQTLVHQVYGSLQMVGFHGAAMLAEEMELLSASLFENTVREKNEALEVLMRSIIQLPDYLERVQETKHDYPTIVLSLLNDIRSVRGASLLSESSLFSPDLSYAYELSETPHELTQNNEQFQSLIVKLRQMYRYAASSAINQIKVDENLAYLIKVSDRLSKVLRGTNRAAVWEIAHAVIEGLKQNVIRTSPTIKNLLRDLDQELKQIQLNGTAALSEHTSEDLLKNLLYYVSSSDANTPAIERVKRHYKIDKMLPVSESSEASKETVLPIDSATLNAVSVAIREEFDQIKTKLDECQQGIEAESGLEFIQRSLQRVNDALAILGVGELRQRLASSIQSVDGLKSQVGNNDDNDYLNFAHGLVDIEARLDSALAANQKSSSTYQLDEAQSAVLDECRNGLERSKDSIVDYIATQFNVNKLESVPDCMRQVRGNLSILSLNKAADILSACILYIETQLIQLQIKPKWQQLDSLADVIASVDYYLEFMSAARENDEDILDKAEQGLIYLGVNKGTVEQLPKERTSKGSLLEISATDNVEIDRTEEKEDSVELNSLNLEADDSVLQDQEDSSFSQSFVSSELDSQIPTVDDVVPMAAVDVDAPENKVASSEVELSARNEDAELIDDELKEIFIEEVGDINEQLAEFFPLWSLDYDNEAALIETRRAFHTLKGSGRMVKALDIGELAWSVEDMLNRVIENTIIPHEMMINLIQKVIDIIPDMTAAYSLNQANPHPKLCEQYQQWANDLSKNVRSPEMLTALTSEESIESSVDDSVALDATDESAEEEIDSQLWEIFHSEAKGHLAIVTEYIHRMDSQKPFYEPPSDSMQRALHTLKGSAHMADLTPIAELVTPLEKFAKELRSYQVSIDEDTLQLFKDGVSYTDETLLQIEKLIYPEIPKLDQFLARVAELRERSVGTLIRLEEAEKAQQKVDPAVLEVLMAEEMHLLLDADLMIEEWQQTHSAGVEEWQPLKDELATLYHGAKRANLQSMADLSHGLESVYQALIEGNIDADNKNYDLMLNAHNELMNSIDAIAAGQDLPQENTALLESLKALSETKINTTYPAFDDLIDDDASLANDSSPDSESEAIELEKTEIDDAVNDEDEAVEIESVAEQIDDVPEVVEDQQGADFSSNEDEQDKQNEVAFESVINETHVSQDSDFVDDDVDEEIVEIFIEEADELIEDMDEAISDWESGESASESNEAIQRALHTFKGGARLAGLKELGDLSHNFEAFLIENMTSEDNDKIIPAVHQYQDQLIQQVANIKVSKLSFSESDTVAETLVDGVVDGMVDQPAQDDPVVTINENRGKDDSSDSAISDSSKGFDKTDQGNEYISNIIPFSSASAKKSGLTVLEEVLKPSSPNTQSPNKSTQKRNQPQEMVKVPAELMEELVNLAGETSISRGRMEEQISDMGYSIEEMGSTVQRLQDQLRRLDIETEAQMVFRQEQMSELEDFDPLEMDRYSQLQQLSRSLMESASDLMDLKNTLNDKTRDTETVLLQQSRINTDLQEGLMRSRMVPFSRIVPRLRRIVRQISNELNKDVNLELGNIEGDLDRSMMERMVAPLEHMLRNAIDHGIEDVNKRLQLGKPAAGRIVITLERDGGDVLILVADDGQGIDVERVKAKAIERNLINPDAALSDQEVLQFILHAGFSTAETITQISGRGVGMDVVNSEIRQMGGSIGIDSRPAEGTAFTVRLPFTVSVNRALMVTMGEVRYAIPLNTIEGIVRISPFELEHYYANPDEPFEYANQEYQLRHLGSLLDNNSPPRLMGSTLPLPVLLVRSSDHSVAVQVDNLQGSREIVVKSLGSQFRSVLGVSGATIMGDGNVVVILDINALIRSSFARRLSIPSFQGIDDQASNAQRVDSNPLVMVVDDSVTVRKVTSRLLEREGYDVITAKDGVDAMVILQEHMPDIMLLDIEMPRMDGFEVAKNVRSSSRLQHLPIIMITSRTGEKHRQRGLESGANLYMGKPYQEEALLEGIHSLIDTSMKQKL